MFIPLGHDRQRTQRFPWITVIIVVLNVFIFCISNSLTIPHESRLEESLTKVTSYFTSHEQVSIDQKTEALLLILEKENTTLKQQINERRFNGSPTLLAQNAEQQTMNQYCHDLMASWEGYWAVHYGFVPSRHLSSPLNYLGSIFLHGGLMHLLGNMLFLILAGIAIEDLWGRGLYPTFYLCCGAIATLSHYAVNPQSIVPAIGASGAIAGLMGAFLVRHFSVKIKFFIVPLFFINRGIFHIPAGFILPLWIFQQLADASSVDAHESGVAFWAHIGGFAFGAICAGFLYYTGIEKRLFTNAIEAKVSFDSSHQVREALALLEKGQTALAVAKLEMRLKAQPNDAPTLMALTRAYAWSGRRNDMHAAYQKAISLWLKCDNKEAATQAYYGYIKSLKPGESVPALAVEDWFSICEYLRSCKRTEEAIIEYETLAQRWPENKNALRGLVIAAELCAFSLQQIARAKELFAQAAAVCQSDPVLQARISAGMLRVSTFNDSTPG